MRTKLLNDRTLRDRPEVRILGMKFIFRGRALKQPKDLLAAKWLPSWATPVQFLLSGLLTILNRSSSLPCSEAFAAESMPLHR